MPNAYLKIQITGSTGIVVDYQMMISSDYFDPAYSWMAYPQSPITADGGLIQIGSIWDGATFWSGQ